MREQPTLVNGELTVQSQPGGGTTITARVPVDAGSSIELPSPLDTM